MTYDNVVKATMFLRHVSDSSKINEIYGNYFSGVLPARSCVEVAKLPKDGSFEIGTIAVKR